MTPLDTDQWLPIRRYRDFYDIPRAFVVEHGGEQLLFDCPFDEALDNYADEYTIYRVSDDFRDRADLMSWTDLGKQFEPIAVIPTTAVRFDPTRRRAIRADVCEGMTGGSTSGLPAASK